MHVGTVLVLEPALWEILFPVSPFLDDVVHDGRLSLADVVVNEGQGVKVKQGSLDKFVKLPVLLLSVMLKNSLETFRQKFRLYLELTGGVRER
jgi:hypothetical protein